MMNKTIYLASAQQQGIWFDLLSKSSSTWSFSSVKCFTGFLDIDRFKGAVKFLAARHSALRTNFLIDEKGLTQTISSEIDTDSTIQVIKLDCIPHEKYAQAIISKINNLHLKEYELDNDILFNILLIQNGSRIVIDINIHHIIVDTMSMSIFWRDLAFFYNNPSANGQNNTPLKQYWQYAAEQHSLLNSDRYQKYVSELIEKLSIPVDAYKNIFKADENNLTFYELDIPNILNDQIRSFSLKHRIVFSSVFLYAYAVLLEKYSGQNSFLITNILHGRGIGKKDYENVIGLFANRLINKIYLQKEVPVIEQIRQISDDLISGFKNSDFPFEQLLRDVKEQQNEVETAFNVSFNLIKGLGKKSEFFGLEESQLNFWGEEKIRFPRGDHDVSLFVIDQITSLKIRIELKCENRWAPMARLFSTSFVDILQRCINKPDSLVNDIVILLPEEEKIIESANNTDLSLQDYSNILDLWDQSCIAYASCKALLYKNLSFSYSDLDKLANSVANELLRKGVASEDTVGIFIGRNQYLIAALLGVLKAGAAYIPLDPEYPFERIKYIIEETNTKVILTDELEKATKYGITLLSVLSIPPSTTSVSTPKVHPEQLAYVIFTSGSTGNPKGVMINHQSVVNFIMGMRRVLNMESKRLYSLTTISFDIFLLEYLCTLCNGGTLVLGTEEEQRDSQQALQAIRDYRINVFQCTPSRLKLILNDVENFNSTHLTELLIGGEPLDEHLVSQLRAKYKNNFYNMYGPTETTVWSSFKKMDKGELISVGRPISNTKIHIINQEFHETGVGAFGEICISGLGLARGYFKKHALTKASFFKLKSVGNNLVYRTGDVGRWLLNGEVEVVGRTDDQIKIRGYRIEPLEIEFYLKQYPNISDAVIVSDESREILYAFIISDENIVDKQIKIFLKKVLPSYMVPSVFFRVGNFPRTLNGKLDRKSLFALIKPETTRSTSFFAVDEKLADAWNAALKIHGISQESLDDNFFDVGGHSLSALKLLRDINNTFNIKIALRSFFENPTLEFLSNEIKSQSHSNKPMKTF